MPNTPTDRLTVWQNRCSNGQLVCLSVCAGRWETGWLSLDRWSWGEDHIVIELAVTEAKETRQRESVRSSVCLSVCVSFWSSGRPDHRPTRCVRILGCVCVCITLVVMMMIMMM